MNSIRETGSFCWPGDYSDNYNTCTMMEIMCDFSTLPTIGETSFEGSDMDPGEERSSEGDSELEEDEFRSLKEKVIMWVFCEAV